MGVSTKVTSFQYTAASTSNIVLSGWGFQPKALILHWVGIASGTDSTAAGDILQGWGFADGTRQNCASHSSVNGGASSNGSTYQRGDAVVVCQTPGTTTLDGYISVSSFDSGGVTFSVPDAISINLTVMVIAIGGTDITNAYTGIETDPAATGNKSNTAIGFQPNIILFAQAVDANTAYPGGAASEDGMSFGVAKASGAGNQYVMSFLEDDSSANMDTGSYIFDNEFLTGTDVSSPASINARKQFVSMDTNGFTFNLLELPQTGGGVTQFNYLAIKGGNWYVGDLLTQTDTSTTVTETGMAASPALVIMASVSKAKSTQDTGTTGLQTSFGAATSTSERMVLAVQDENGTASAETSRGVEYDAIYANISTADAIQGLGDISAITSDGFTFIMDDADPAQYFAWWVALAPSATGTDLVVADAAAVTQTDAVVTTKQSDLVVTDAFSTSQTDAVVTTKSDTLIIPDAFAATQADTLVLSILIDLVVADAACVTQADAVALEHIHVLVVADGTSTTQTDAVTLEQVHILTVADGASTSQVDAVVVDLAATLTVANVFSTTQADAVVVTQTHVLLVADADATTQADAVTLEQIHVLVVTDGDVTTQADAVVLATAGDLVVADAFVTTQSDNVTLTQTHVLVVADAASETQADAVLLATAGDLVVASAYVTTQTDSFVITKESDLIVADAACVTQTDALVLTQAHSLTVADSYSDTQADALTLTQTHVLIMAMCYAVTQADAVVVVENGANVGIIRAWTLPERDIAWSLAERDIAWSLRARDIAWSMDDRGTASTLSDRDTSLTMEER